MSPAIAPRMKTRPEDSTSPERVMPTWIDTTKDTASPAGTAASTPATTSAASATRTLRSCLRTSVGCDRRGAVVVADQGGAGRRVGRELRATAWPSVRGLAVLDV